VVRDGLELTDLCGSALLCRTSASEIQCTVSEPGAYQYLVRAKTWSTVAGQRVESVLEGRFPAAPQGFAPFEPSAEIHFGKAPDGRVRSIAIQYAPRSGSCVVERGQITVVAEGTTLKAESWQDQSASAGLLGEKCLQGTVLVLNRPYTDASVSLIPKNRSGLVGEMAFASTAAPKTPPVVVHVGAYASGGASEATGGPKQGEETPATPLPPPPLPREKKSEAEPRLTHVYGDLQDDHFSGFQLQLHADPETVYRGVNVQGWWVPSAQGDESRVISFRPQRCLKSVNPKAYPVCGKGPAEGALKIPSISTRNIEKQEFETTLSIAESEASGLRAPRLLCFQVQLNRLDKDKLQGSCWSVIVDESLLGAELPSTKKP
jgi:hypothetical protein